MATFNQLLWIALRGPKGKQVNIPALERGDFAVSTAKGVVTQVNLLTLPRVRVRDLFSNLNSHDPGIGSAGDRVVVVVKHRGYCGVSCALGGP